MVFVWKFDGRFRISVKEKVEFEYRDKSKIIYIFEKKISLFHPGEARPVKKLIPKKNSKPSNYLYICFLFNFRYFIFIGFLGKSKNFPILLKILQNETFSLTFFRKPDNFFAKKLSLLKKKFCEKTQFFCFHKIICFWVSINASKNILDGSIRQRTCV